MTLFVCYLSFRLYFHVSFKLWVCGRLYLKLGPGFNSILVPPLHASQAPWSWWRRRCSRQKRKGGRGALLQLFKNEDRNTGHSSRSTVLHWYTRTPLYSLYSEFQTETKALLAVNSPAQLQPSSSSKVWSCSPSEVLSLCQGCSLDRGMFLHLDRFVDSDRAYMIPERLNSEGANSLTADDFFMLSVLSSLTRPNLYVNW